MKKLFETDKHILRVVGDAEFFEWFDSANNKIHAFDRKGQEIEGYKRSELVVSGKEELEGRYPDDPTAIDVVNEGLYAYSTHPVEWDPDGCFGIIGFKNLEGAVVVEEQYEQVDYFFNGLCSVKKKDSGWGCIDKAGNEVITFKYEEPVRFNKYGVAMADDYLIDRNEIKLEGTDLNYCNSYFENDRYFMISMDTEEQLEAIDGCGYAEDLTVDIYDTKNKVFVARNVPEDRLYLYEFSGGPEEKLINTANELLSEYDEVNVLGPRVLIAEKSGVFSVFDYYS